MLGALALQLPPRASLLLPGTHSKWARVETGCVVDFRTFMTGEIYAALLEHTIRNVGGVTSALVAAQPGAVLGVRGDEPQLGA